MGKFYNTFRLTLVLLCQSVIYEPVIATNLDAVVTAIGRGQRNQEIAQSLKAMQAAAQQEISVKDPRRNQYMLATTLSVGEDNQLTTAADNVKYYENVHWRAVANLSDCDPTCIQGIDEIQSKLQPGETLAGPTLGGGKCRMTDVHTELLFLFGAHFRNQLKSGGILPLYSHYIPCAGLSQCSFGECAGNLAYYRYAVGKRDVYFVIIYGTLFNPGGQDTGSNARLSQLYQALGGIPLLHCSSEDSETVCRPTISDDEAFDTHLTNPVYQRFPRVYRNDRNQPQVYTECLARGNFIQHLTRSNPRFRITLMTDKILTEFTQEYLLDQLGKAGIPYYESLQSLLDKLKLKWRDEIQIQVALNLCDKFMKCLNNYPDGELLLDTALKKELEKKANTSTRDAFCTTFGKALKLLHKSTPDICAKKLFN